MAVRSGSKYSYKAPGTSISPNIWDTQSMQHQNIGADEAAYLRYDPDKKATVRVSQDEYNEYMNAGPSSPLGSLGGIFGSLTGGAGAGGGTGGGATPGGSTNSSGGGSSSITGPINEKEVRAQSFARAKEQVGQTTGSAVKALQEMYAGQGMTGSSVEGAAIGGAVGGGARNLANFTADQAFGDQARAQADTMMRYGGGITQRGQDMGMLQALLSLLGMGGTSTTTSSGNYSGSLY